MRYTLFIILTVSFLLLWLEKGIAQQQEEYELTSIDFEGNSAFSDSDLSDVLQSKETPWWFWRFLDSFTPLGSPANYFDSTMISIDIISLKSFYAVNGYFEAEISYSYDVDTSALDAELTYIINENDMHTYGTVNNYGIETLDEYMRSLVNPFSVYPEELRFIQANVDDNNQRVVSILKNNGFMFAAFDSTVINIDTVNNKANLDNYFTHGKYYTYNEIRIEKAGEGEKLVSDELVKYVTGIDVGDPYRQETLSRSRLRLARTGLFNSINLKGIAEDTAGNKVPLLVQGNIGALNELSPEVFADNELNTFNLGVGASYVRKNFLGDARKLTVRTRFRINDVANVTFSSSDFEKKFQTEIDLSLILEQPFLFSRRIAGQLEGYLKSYDISSVDYNNYGVELTSAFDMPSYTFVNLFNPYLRIDRLDYNFPFEINSDTVTADAQSFTASFGAEIGSTTTNDIFFPTKGRTISLISEISSASVDWQYGEPYNLTENWLGYYYKLQLTFGFYLPVSTDNKTVVGIKAKSGYIQMIEGGQELVAPNQTFFAGGSNSVRGWRARELIPANPISTILPPGLNEELRIRGGTFLLEGSFEYRRKFEEEFGFALFVDYGNTWNSYTDIRFDQIAAAIGLGLRYYSPIAPFRIDFGFKLYDPSDRKFIFDKAVLQTLAFHFGIGEAF